MRFSFEGDGDLYDRIYNNTLTEPGAFSRYEITDQFGESCCVSCSFKHFNRSFICIFCVIFFNSLGDIKQGEIDYVLYLDYNKGYFVGYQCIPDSSSGTYQGKQ